MTGLQWLDGYSGQTTNELTTLAATYRADSIVLAFEQALDQKADRAGFGGLSVEERVVLAVEALEREVNNGGYDQFFVNAYAEHVQAVVDGLHRIGCGEVAKLTQDAIDALRIDGPCTREAIACVIYEEDEIREERLSECDDRFFEMAGDLSGPLLEFIKRNSDRITL